MHNKKQAGSAIVTAIFVVALVAIVATSIALFSRNLIHSAISSRERMKTQFLLDAPIPLVEDAFDQPSPPNQGLGFKTQKNGVIVHSYTVSPQLLLNINLFSHLNEKDQPTASKNLSLFLASIGVPQDPTQLANNLITALNHTITATGDALSLYQWPGYPFTQFSDLRAVPGMTLETYRLLSDWLTVLPTSAFHVPNAMHWQVLIAFGLSSNDAKRVATCSDQQAGIELTQALTNCQLPTALIPTDAMSKLTLLNNLSYFKIVSYYFSHDREYESATLLYRNKSNNQNKWYVVWQHNDTNE
jgi:type II secretory pathway component PulK